MPLSTYCAFCETSLQEANKIKAKREAVEAQARAYGTKHGHSTMYVVKQAVNGALSFRNPTQDLSKVEVIDELYVPPAK